MTHNVETGLYVLQRISSRTVVLEPRRDDLTTLPGLAADVKAV